jgi:hypothetical protein
MNSLETQLDNLKKEMKNPKNKNIKDWMRVEKIHLERRIKEQNNKKQQWKRKN